MAAYSRFGEFSQDWTSLVPRELTSHSEIMKHVLAFPQNTRVEFKSHDSSIQQRTALDEQRREKANQHHNDKRGARLSGE